MAPVKPKPQVRRPPRVRGLRFTVLNDGLARSSSGGLTVLWTLCRVRQPHDCSMCGEQHEAGEEMFRPITEDGHGAIPIQRYARVCAACAKRST